MFHEHENRDTTPLGSQVLICPKYDMDAYMTTHFAGEAWDSC